MTPIAEGGAEGAKEPERAAEDDESNDDADEG